jgi:NADPH2:quinone reductase
MRAFQIAALDGPDALEPVERPDPEPSHFMSPGAGVVIDVQAAGVSFPDLLMSRGLYQMKPELPFVPGGEVAGTVVSGEGFAPGDRVAAMTVLGGFAERAVAPPLLTFRLPDALDWAQGAALVLNYHTVWFALVTRGGVAAGETVLVHGAAGGVGTAALQVARALGARTIAVVSSDEKERVARSAGADEVLRSDGPWKDEARSLGGVDVVLDPVGGDRFTDSLRSLREGGRVVVVGFTGGSIPEVRVNRLLLNNVSVVGAGWGAFAMGKPDYLRSTGLELDRLIEAGHVRPVVGRRLAFDEAAEALRVIDRREALGKVVLERDSTAGL